MSSYLNCLQVFRLTSWSGLGVVFSKDNLSIGLSGHILDVEQTGSSESLGNWGFFGVSKGGIPRVAFILGDPLKQVEYWYIVAYEYFKRATYRILRIS